MKAWFRVVGASVAAVAACGAVTAAGSFQEKGAAPAQSGQSAPWPDAATMAERKKAADNRALFSSDAPVEFTLTADFKAVQRDRNPKSMKIFPATLTLNNAEGKSTTFSLNVRTRGHVRRMVQTCTFAPLRLEFQADQIKGTIFEGHKNLKLGTHCRDADLFEQYVPREYAAYRMFNLLTPRSFRARLAKATYVDSTSKHTIDTRMAIFIEDDDDVARRLEGRNIETQKLVFRQVDFDTVTLLTLFEYMIGNTDMSMFLLHNVVLVQTQKGTIFPIPYNFDYSGLVDARYAVPAKQFNLSSVRDRLYRGPCRAPADLEPFFARMTEVKPQVLKLLDDIPGLDDGYRNNARKYLDRFYQTISKPGEVKKAFVDECNNRSGM